MLILAKIVTTIHNDTNIDKTMVKLLVVRFFMKRKKVLNF